MPKVSIIIPVYNAASFINRCIDSVLAQTYKDFQIIAVNDGSKDNSLELLKAYESNPNFILLDQENSGPSVARNNGINRADGEYLMFIDSDDYIDSDYVECYINIMADGRFDVVMGGYKKITGEHIDFVRCPNGKAFSKYLVTGPVAKLYKKDFITDNNILFPITTSSEDVHFNANIIRHGAKIGFVDNTGYYYYFNPNSISNTAHKGFSENVDILELMEAINYKELKEDKVHQYFIIRYIVWYLLYAGKNVAVDKFIYEYNKYFSWLEKNIPDYIKNPYIRPFGPAGDQKQIGLIIFVFMIFHKLKLMKFFAKIYCKY